MSIAQRLPVEILNDILHVVWEEEGQAPLEHLQHWQNGTTLKACCLINHAWSLSATPYLYSTIHLVYTEWHLPRRLWCFLRTIISNPSLGLFVKQIDLRNHDIIDRAKLKDEDPPNTDLMDDKTFRKHVQRCRQDSTTDAWGAVKAMGPRRLCTLLNEHLPSVDKMRLWLDTRNSPQTDLELLSCQSFANKIREIVLTKDTQDYGWRNSFGNYGVVEMFRSPTVRKIAMLDVDLYGMQDMLRQHTHWYGMSDIEELILAPEQSRETFETGLTSLLKIPKTLVSLSLCLHMVNNGFDLEGEYPLGNDLLWITLHQLRHSLRYLDLHHVTPTSTYPHMPLNPILLPLTDFNALRTLRIQPEALVGGGHTGIEWPSYELQDTLPRDLISLTLYGFNRFNSYASISRQLIDVAKKDAFPSLRFLLLGDRTFRPERKPFDTDTEIDRKNKARAERERAARIIHYKLMSCSNQPLNENLHVWRLGDYYLPKGGLMLTESVHARDPESYVARLKMEPVKATIREILEHEGPDSQWNSPH